MVLLAAIVAVSQAVVIPGAGLVASHGAYPAGYPAYPGFAPRVAAPLGYHGGAAVVAKVAAPIDDYDPNPQYSYSYDIHVR